MVGIGVTTFNRNLIAKRNIGKIKSLTKSDYKLIVVDDGSDKPFHGATFRFNENQGAPIAKNKCLELLQDCEHIFLFDDDTYPTKEGWEKAYIDSGVKHLNYSFKYAYEVVDGVRHLKNPNGCMMYIHKSVIDKVGGFDTGFKKYGYWHGAFSNRVYNVGLIPHPFIDIVDSEKYLFCLDQKKSTHRTATVNRGRYLSDNKKRYFEKIDSTEYIDFMNIEPPKIWYSNPFNTDKNIGKALNEFCELVPDGDWICLQDGDMMYLTPDWGKQIEDVVKSVGDTYGLIGCVTNRLGRNIQRVGDMDDNHDILYHYEIAKDIKESNYGVVEDITNKRYVAGMLMLFPKKVWSDVKFPENNIAFDDAFSKAVTRKGYKLGLMRGLYVYHFYRAWSTNPKTSRAHLK